MSFELDPDYAIYAGTTGIDEAGRGCLAGPVVVASVTWRPETVARHDWFQELADSKVLKAETRERLYPHIVAEAERVRVAVISAPLIDYLNILRASLYGFERTAPPFDPERPLLIDGNQRPPTLPWAKTVVKGDARLSAVAAAGIVAKVTRDAIMVVADTDFPGYGFAGHKGYAAKTHRQAIADLGPSALHRKSFRPVSDYDTPTKDADVELTQLPVGDPVALEQAWRHFITNYHRYSLSAARVALQHFTREGMDVIPMP